MALMVFPARAQVTGKFGKFYDQRESLFESLPTSESDIIFLGNSITNGGTWEELFQNSRCKNRGISGDVIPGVLNRLETITKGKPAMVFLMIGTNDMARGDSPETITEGISRIVRQIKEQSPKTRIIVQSVLPVNDCFNPTSNHGTRWETVPVINQLVREMTEKEEVEYLDLYSHFVNEEGKLNTDYSNDGLHLNGAGYQLWKNIIEEEIGSFSRPVYTSKVPLWLNLNTGSSLLQSFDKGASPMRYIGYGINLALGATIEWNRYHIQADMRGMAGLLTNIVGTPIFDFDIETRAEMLYRVREYPQQHLKLWAGGAVHSLIDIHYFSQLMNASIGISDFVDLQAVGMLQYDFAFYDGAHNLLTLYGKLSLPLLAGVDRPGFAYMDNYTSDLNTANTIMKDYETFSMLLPGASTDVGLRFNLPNNNRISVSYCWDYLTTRNRGTYRFDRAAHSFLATYMFNLK